MSQKLIRDKYLTKNLLVLDGLTGTGKSMMAALLESYSRVEVGRFIYDVEYVSISEMLGAQRSDSAEALLGLIIDSKLYDNMISREINFRPSDLSSVLKIRTMSKYLKRLFYKDGEVVAQRIKDENPIMLINTHQMLPAIDSLLKQFQGRVKVIEMERHPLYLLEHWVSYIDMHGSSARDFTIWLEDSHSRAVPWFACEWVDEYWSLSKFDRAVLSIESLTKNIDKKYNSISNSVLKAIPFEDFSLNTGCYVEELAAWIGTSTTKQTKNACTRQNLPRKNINAGLNKKIYQRHGYDDTDKFQSHFENYKTKLSYAKRRQSDVSKPILEKLIERYETNYKIWF